jgi:hypothetical protein
MAAWKFSLPNEVVSDGVDYISNQIYTDHDGGVYGNVETLYQADNDLWMDNGQVHATNPFTWAVDDTFIATGYYKGI